MVWAEQVYIAVSSTSPPFMTRELSSIIEYSPLGFITAPSLNQKTTGAGIPLTGHLMVMVVFEAAVTLSPMVMFTGLPSPTRISCPDSETSICGFTGSVEISKCTPEYCYKYRTSVLFWLYLRGGNTTVHVLLLASREQVTTMNANVRIERCTLYVLMEFDQSPGWVKAWR